MRQNTPGDECMWRMLSLILSELCIYMPELIELQLHNRQLLTEVSQRQYMLILV